MRRYENKPQSRRGGGPRFGSNSRAQGRPFAETPPKATVDEPWVFVLGAERQSGPTSLEALISEKVVSVPLQKRSLLILPPQCAGEGVWGNLCGLGEETGPEAAQRIKDPAFSIAASAERILSHIENKEIELGTFGRIVVFDLGLDQEKRSAFIDNANLILDKASNKTIEVHFFTDSDELPSNYPASAIKKSWQKPAERAVPERPAAPTERTRQAADRHKERQMLTKTEEKPSPEEMSEKIKKILEQTLAYPHPEELEELKKLIQRNIPLGRRTYFAAYLLLRSSMEKPAAGRRFPERQSAGRPASRRPASEGSAERRGERAERSEDRPMRKPERKPASGVNFYINVGFHDHMNPRALASFIAENCGIKPEDVCDINLKPAYAFFTVRTELAGGIPEGLNGKMVGKKTVKANLAEQRPPRPQRPRQDSAFRGQQEAPSAAAQTKIKPQAQQSSAQQSEQLSESGTQTLSERPAAEPRAAAKPQTAPEALTAAEAQAAPETKTEAKPQAAPETKTEAKPQAAPETQTAAEPKTEAKPQAAFVPQTGSEAPQKPEVLSEER